MSKKALTPATFPGQHDGEEVMMVIHQHPLVMRKVFIWGLVAIVVGVLPLDIPQIYAIEWLPDALIKLALAVTIIVLVAWFYRWIGWYYTCFIVTNYRILDIKQKGFFNRRVNETQMDKIMNLNYHVKGLQAVLFSFGDINVEVITGQSLKMSTIHKPVKIHSRLMEVVKACGGNPRHFSEDQVA